MDKSRVGKRNKRAGAEAERELAKILREEYGFADARRGYSFRHEPDVMGVVSVHVEAKYCSDIKLSTWIRQAVEASERLQDGIPAVFHRRKREPWFVSMLQDDFDEMNPDDVLIKPCTGTCNPLKDIDDKCDGVLYFRKIGNVVTVPLKEWVGIYWNWKLPFTE